MSSPELTQDTFRQYLNEIGKYELLNREQEADRAKRIAAGVAAEEMLKEHIPASLGQTALQDMVVNGQYAKEDLTNRNLRLVITIAKKYRDKNVPLPDAVQSGNVGLMRAVEKFDHTKGYKFSTYASWWIRQQVQRSNPHQSGTACRVPMEIHELITRIRGFENTFLSKFGSNPTDDEVASHFEISKKKLLQVRQAGMHPSSLNMPVREDGGTEVGDLIPDASNNDQQHIARLDDNHMIRKLMKGLDERSQYIIAMRFGLNDSETIMTLEAIGASVGLTRERVRQLEKRALKAMQAAASTHGYKWFAAA